MIISQAVELFAKKRNAVVLIAPMYPLSTLRLDDTARVIWTCAYRTFTAY